MFGFSASKSSSSSSSSSYEEAKSRSDSAGASQSTSNQRIAFEDIFARMFGGAEGAAAGLDPSMLTDAANMLFGGGMDFMGQIGGDVGTQFLKERIAGDNPLLQEQIDLLQEDIGKLFNEELLPGVTSSAVHGGALGGGRQGVAQGAAIREASDQFTRGSVALRAGDLASRDAAASTLAGNAITGAQTAFAACLP